MRQVFSSPRIHNVEGIAKMLTDEGIEVRITHGRSYKSAWSGRRTYKESETGGSPIPAVWVVRSEDQPRARQILREAGLLDSTRGGSDSFLPESSLGTFEVRAAAAPTKRAFRYKMGLLIAIVLAVGLAWVAAHRANTNAPVVKAPVAAKPVAGKRAAATPAAAQTAPADPVPGAYPVETPPALATMLAGVELASDAPATACLRIDGTAATKPQLTALPASKTRFDCTGASSVLIDIRGYRTDGSGTGTVELAVTSAGAQATQVRTLLVRRTEDQWRVLRVLSVR